MKNPLAKLRLHLATGPFSEGRFITNVATIMAGTAFSQIIALLAMPILVRIYSPENFGVLAMFVMLANNLSMLACLQYQGAIILPKRNESAFLLWVGCIGMTAITATGCGLVVWAFGDTIAGWLGTPELADWLWLLPLSMFAWGGFEASAIWSTRLKDFKSISIGTVQRRLGMAGVQLAMGPIAKSEAGLITGQLTGELLGFALLSRRGLKNVSEHDWKHLGWRQLRILLHRYRRFPQYTLFSSFASALARNMPVLCLGVFFNPAIVGFFALAHRGLVGPLQIGVTSITRVFFERANRAKHAGNLSELTLRAYRRLVIVVLTPLLLLCIVAPDATSLVLGPGWEQTGVFLRWLSLWLFFMATASPLHRLFAILERQNELAIINGLLFIFSTAALVIGGRTGDPVVAIALYSICSSLVWLGQGARILHIAGVKLSDATKILAAELIQAIPYALALLLMLQVTPNIYLRTAAFFALGMIFALLRARSVLSGQD